MKIIINAYLSNKKTNGLLLLLSIYCGLLLLFRAKITQSIFYFFLVWNLFLAAVPYLVLTFAKQKIQLLENVKSRALLFIVWLLFLPNSFYILTDFVHLKKGNPELFWFDLVLLFSFASLGFLFGLLSLKEFKNCFSLFYSKTIITYSIPMICLLSGFGIYLGRFLRFNSWTIITNPFQLLIDSFQTLLSFKAILFSVLYGSLIYLTYQIKNHLNERA
ncbi:MULTISPECIES: DUF1361 domain-containing protein [Flavobacterium]|uniref:DUF1361 domain-containing protein n=1 Tax=Flavobacterium jumunjinense TaxID=998845 RepID=A0ABV5GMV0_9FLAO|nr:MULTISPECIES: DUF1361 domain-containing protein [Flavobacterium]